MRSYRERMHEYAKMPALELWYDRLDEKNVEAILDAAGGKPAPATRSKKLAAKTWHAFPGFVSVSKDEYEISDQRPLLFHPKNRRAFLEMISEMFRRYRTTLSPDRKALFDRFTLRDAAYKVVGVGSVGTRCLVALFTASDGSPLVLQVKKREHPFWKRTPARQAARVPARASLTASACFKRRATCSWDSRPIRTGTTTTSATSTT